MSSESLTANYVNQLKAALVLKNEECDTLKQQNVKLTYQISQMETHIHELDADKKFHESRASLITSCQNSSSNPSSVINTVSSWLPTDIDGSIACCLKIGDQWMIIEENDEVASFLSTSGDGSDTPGSRGGRLSRTKHISACVTTAMLEEIVLCCGISADGICNTNPIDESILPSMGWSPDHDSVAVVVCPQCVWMLVSVHSQQTVHSIRGFYNLLESASELIMTTVSRNITQDDVSVSTKRKQSSLSICDLLLTPVAPLATSTPSTGTSSASALKVWETLPQVLATAATSSMQRVNCDVLLLVNNIKPMSVAHKPSASPGRDPVGGTDTHGATQYATPLSMSPSDPCCCSCTGPATLLSATLGPLQRPSRQSSPSLATLSSLAETAINDQMDVLICNDPHNIARDTLLDCGITSQQGRSSNKSNSNWDSNLETSSTEVYLAILPLWITPEHAQGKCFLYDKVSRCPLLGVSGAIIYRKQGQPFTDNDIAYLQHVRSDSVMKVCHWLETHLCGLLGELSEGGEPSAGERAGQHQHQYQHHLHATEGSGGSSTATVLLERGLRLPPILPISKHSHQDLLEVFLQKGFVGMMAERAHAVNTLLTTHFGCDWVVLIDMSSVHSENSTEAENKQNQFSHIANNRARSSTSVPLLLLDDHGETTSLNLSQDSIDTNPLSQAIKHFLHVHANTNSSTQASTVADKVIVLNYLLTEHATTLAGTDELHTLVNSLLNEDSTQHLSPRGVGGVNDLTPLHVFCTKLTLCPEPPLSPAPTASNTGAVGEYIAIGGRRWTPLEPQIIQETTHDMEIFFQTIETCRQKDTLYDVIAAAKDDIETLEDQKRVLEAAEEVVSEFHDQLSREVASEGATLRTHSHVLLEALHFSTSSRDIGNGGGGGGGVFPSNSQLVVCGADAITGRHWQLVDTHGRVTGSQTGVIRWRPMDAGLKNMVAWPAASNGSRSIHMSSDLLAEKTANECVQTRLGVFLRAADSGPEAHTTPCYHLHQLSMESAHRPVTATATATAPTESSSTSTLVIYLLIVCPEISQVEASLSPFIRHWMTSLEAFFSAHSSAIIYPHTHHQHQHQQQYNRSSSLSASSHNHDHEDSSPTGSVTITPVSSITKVLSSAVTFAAACTQQELQDLQWVTPALKQRGDRDLEGRVSGRGGSMWDNKPFEYLTDVTVWDNAIRDCCNGLVSMLVPLLELNVEQRESLTGSSLHLGECVDLLHTENIIPSAIQELIAADGTTSSQDRVQFQYSGPTSSLSVIDHHCPVVRKTLQSYLQGKGNFNLNIVTDTVLQYSCKSVSVSSGLYQNIHVFLLLPLDCLFTYADLAQLEANITATLAPIALLQAHTSLRGDISRLCSLFHPVSEQGRGTSRGATNSLGMGMGMGMGLLPVNDGAGRGAGAGPGASRHHPQNLLRHVSWVAVETAQKTPLHELIHTQRVSSVLDFLDIIPDLFASKSMYSTSRAAVTLETYAKRGDSMSDRLNQESSRGDGSGSSGNSGRGTRADPVQQYKYKLIDGTVYTFYGSDEPALTPSSSASASASTTTSTPHNDILYKAATHNYFKQQGRSIKKTFHGNTALLPLPESLPANSLQVHVVPSGVRIDILSERHLSRYGREHAEGEDKERGEEEEVMGPVGGLGGEAGGESEGDDSAEDEETPDNPLGSVQFIRISFFHQPAVTTQYASQGNSDSNGSGSGSGSESSTHFVPRAASTSTSAATILTHEKVVVLLRGIVVTADASSHYNTQGASSLVPQAQARHFTARGRATSVDSHNQSAVMVPNLIPLGDLHLLAQITNHGLSHLADMAGAASTEHKEQSQRIGRYHSQVDELLSKVEHMFMQIANPKLRNIHSLTNLSSPSMGEALGTDTHRKYTHSDALDSSLSREHYYKSQSNSGWDRGRLGGGSEGVAQVEGGEVPAGMQAQLARGMRLSRLFGVKVSMNMCSLSLWMKGCVPHSN